MASERRSTASEAKSRTALAILVAFLAWLILYALYRLLFIGVVAVYARYDPGYSAGIGAFILIVLAPNVFSSFGAVIVAGKWFKRANLQAVYYSFATIIVLLTAISTLIEIAAGEMGSVIAVIFHAITAVVSVVAARFAVNFLSWS